MAAIPDAGHAAAADGKPNLSAPAPRAADGHPDLTGVWEVLGDLVMPTDGRIRSKYVYNIGVDLPGGTRRSCRGRRRSGTTRQKALGVGAPSEKCLPHGIPDAMLTRTLPFKMVQTPGVTIILFEEFNNWRQVFTDGRPLPVDPEPAWLGYSIGRWETTTSSSKPPDSTTSRGSTPAARRTPRRCAPPSGSAATTSATWTSSSPSTTRRPSRGKWSTTVKFILLPDTDLLESHCDNNKWIPDKK